LVATTNSRTLLGWSALVLLGTALVRAQETHTIEQLSRQLRQMQQDFDRQQREVRENLERVVRDQQAQIDALKRQLDAARTNPPPAAPAPSPPGVQPLPAATAARAASATAPSAPAATGAGAAGWSPAQPIRIGSAKNYLDLSFDALVAAGGSTADDVEQLQLGGHDPNQRGFTVQNLELVLAGAVDPYFRGQASVALQIDAGGETGIEAEEAYLETLSLPANLQVKAGQFFSEFGRLNPTHPHTWDFVDQALVNGRFFGPDGMRNPGARIAWLAPTPFYSELGCAIQNSQGSTAYSFRDDHDGAPFFGRPVSTGSVENFGDLLVVPRYAAAFDLSSSQTLLGGVSGAFGPNGAGGDTQILGLDLFWKWKSPRHHAGFPFVTWQTEAMLRRFEAAAFPGDASTPALPGETLTDYGLYTQLAYGFRKGWVSSLRFDYLFPDRPGAYEAILGPDSDRAMRWRLSPAIAYYPSEFSKLRLQYNFDHRQAGGDDHSVWLQFEILLGAHAAHKF
jgi:hypothetical protein